MIDLTTLTIEDKAYIKEVCLAFHAKHIKPADRLMRQDEKMPWGFVEHSIPESWKEEYT